MLALEHVTRTYDERRALDDVSFTVRPGRMTGFVGANGAGKTTAMRIIMGVLAPTSGEVTFDGRPLTREVRRTFGYMPEERGLYPRMRVLDQLVHLGRVHGMSRAAASERAAGLLDQLGLAERSHDPLQTLSLGNQQRVQVAAAVLHEPRLLVLDEPFSGLDPLAIDAMGDLLRSHAAAGVPVLFSSHQLELVEQLCDDVVIISDGRVVSMGSADDVRARRSGRRYRIQVEGASPVADLVGGITGVTVVRGDADTVLVELDDSVDDQALLSTVQAQGVLREFAVVRPTLAEIFREVVR
ncbi:ATP-binding cassette domain-containing protein [Isoptericola sp. b441]|uniref:ATP-binding cassette domain-containing protein n=1 Tax=Actinotalea lenta TaxID=3064654 RepID=A0ABT9D779_9CELL|nr:MULTISPECIES: ATP-binding cassette domain-containing protein [unclassified Isoptericola]MDO8105923.1 ATP-binding cassette domain-containing protein [Isoptericola sp. b441]MDO8122638.1 ATP-binding cassette domain-containing protein [Isoptericola sp. b490]